jgi:hypothetical protein
MKRFYYSILLICVSVITFNCQKEINYSLAVLPGTGNNNADPVTATLQGNIIDENDQPAADVTIRVGNKTATTDGRGYFRIIDAALDKNASLVVAEKAGYFKAFRTFSATSGANQVRIQLIKKVSAGSVNTASGGTVALSNGSKILLTANGIVKATGAPYSGSVNVYAAYIDPSSSDIAQTVPGSFLGNDKDKKKVLLSSYGMLAVDLESSTGEKLQIAPGSKATIATVIPASLQASAPASISLWYVDEQTGIWKEEGTAAKNGTSYVGEVKHFTYWNCDVAGPVVNLSALFKNPAGLPLVYADIRIRPVTGYSSAHGITDSLGQVSGPVPANTNLVMEILGPCFTVIYSKNIGPFSADVNLGDITADNTVSVITVEGALRNCNGAPVTDGYAIVYYNNEVRYVGAQNANGDFATTFFTCPGMPVTCEILGVDETAQQQGAMTNVSVTSPTTYSGNIIICGVATAQYVNYTLDAVDYSITRANNDSLIAYSYPTQTTPAFFTWLSGAKLTGNDYIAFGFGHDAAADTYPLNSLSVQGFDSVTVVQPSTVTLTNYPANAGSFYEGTFSGQFTKMATSLPVYNISGSFRIRRQ